MSRETIKALLENAVGSPPWAALKAQMERDTQGVFMCIPVSDEEVQFRQFCQPQVMLDLMEIAENVKGPHKPRPKVVVNGGL